MSTLSLVRQQEPKQPTQTELEYEDATMQKALSQLYSRHEGKKLTKEEEKEFEDLLGKVVAKYKLDGGAMSEAHADHDRKDLIARVHRELRVEYGEETVTKKLLIDRLASAYSLALTYERYLTCLKYSVDENGTVKYQGFMAHVMKEVRKGIESSNDQIIRLTQALRDINRPPITVKAKNAFFAQNQQVNQGMPPRDLENNSSPDGQYAPHSRRMSKAPVA